MNKLLLSILFIFFIGSTVKSQVLISLIFGDKLNSPTTEFGLNVGVNYSTLTRIDNAKYRTGFGIGMYFTWKFHDRWQLQPELFFRFPTGATKLPPYNFQDTILTQLTSTSTILRNSRSLSIPINIKYRVWKQFRISIAPQVSYITYSDDIFKKTLENKDEVAYKTESKSDLNRFDLGVSAGISWKLKQGKGVNIELRFYSGFLDTDSKHLQGMNANRAILLYVGIPTGAEKDVKTSEGAN